MTLQKDIKISTSITLHDHTTHTHLPEAWPNRIIGSS